MRNVRTFDKQREMHSDLSLDMARFAWHHTDVSIIACTPSHAIHVHVQNMQVYALRREHGAWATGVFGFIIVCSMRNL